MTSNNKLGMDFGPYFQPFFNFCFYTCLIPFKVVNNNGEVYSISANPVQKVICAFVHLMIFLASMSEIQSVVVKFEQRQADPELFLRTLDRINSGAYGIIFAHTVWFKRNAVLAIFGEPQMNKNVQKIERFVHTGLVALIVSFSTFGYVSWILSFDWSTFDINKNIYEYPRIQDLLYDNFYPRTRSIERKYLEMTTGLQIGGALSILARFYYWVLVDLLYWLTNISAIISFALAKKFTDLLANSSPQSALDESSVFGLYYKIKETMKRLNELFGPMYVVVVIAVIFFCGVSIVDILNSKTLTYPILMAIYFLLASLMLTLSAEANYKMSQFKNWILGADIRTSGTIAKYLEVDNSNIALRGGRLFTITYGFMGTASSALLTYAIIMLQFRGTSNYSTGTMYVR